VSAFRRDRDGRLCAEGVDLETIAHRFGTPTYVYSRAALEAQYDAFARACIGQDHLICYAMKANSNLAVIDLFARRGAGFDVVSGGELARVVAAGGDVRKVVFSGVGKSEAEMRAALAADILCFNVESESELARLDHVAGAMGRRARISLRVNPDVDPKTHPYISTGLRKNKFGVAYADAMRLYRDAASRPHLHVTGIDFHIGSQLVDAAPVVEALDRVLALVERLAGEGIAIEHLDLGGGLGVRYKDESPPSIGDYLAPILARLHGRALKLVLEPGRILVGEGGLLLTRVEYLKQGEAKSFAIVDAAMNDLLRPALYDAWHDVVPVAPPGRVAARRYDVVGPVCESGDFLASDRELALAEGELVAILTAGAYGMGMSSNYNTRPRAAEVMVDGRHVHLVRRRESIAELFAAESRLP
jgi:diaminopimelate decarboxylase